MSESTGGGATNQTSGASDQNQENVNPFQKDMFKFKEQARQAQAKAEELERKLRERELEEEEKKGNLTKVLDEYKEKTRSLETNLKQKDFIFSRNNIVSSIKHEAIKAGCKDPDAFVRLLGKEKIDTITVDENFNPSLDDVKSVLNDGMKTYEHIGLFGKNVNIINGLPDLKQNLNQKPKTEKEILASYMKNKGW